MITFSELEWGGTGHGRFQGIILAGVTMTYLRSYVAGSNDAIFNEVGRTMAVSGGSASLTRGCVRTQLLDTSSWSR
jgi:hypothetical protein